MGLYPFHSRGHVLEHASDAEPDRLVRLSREALESVLAEHRAFVATHRGRRANLTFHDLSGLDLRGRKLGGINLTGSCLRGTLLSGADLTDGNLFGADLSEADMTEASLVGADLRGVLLRDAKLARCNLTRADLREGVLLTAGREGLRI